MTPDDYKRLLRDERWRRLREAVLELDGHACQRCGASHQKGMHVHHTEYRAGLLPWEYPLGTLETLCARCHAAEHGLLPPKHGWIVMWETDLGDISSACECCETPIRYVWTIWHEQYGFLDVGVVCCDDMTGTEIASAARKLAARRTRFLSSTRWRRDARGRHRIRQSGLDVTIVPRGAVWRVEMMYYDVVVPGRRTYRSVESAKNHIFDVIVDGSARAAVQRRVFPAARRQAR